MENTMETKFNAKQEANKFIASHLEKLEIPGQEKLRKDLKLSQSDSALMNAYITLQKAELLERFTRVKKSKSLEAGKETPENK
jgi:hypothetical protein